jgi:hypothetical protein
MDGHADVVRVRTIDEPDLVTTSDCERSLPLKGRERFGIGEP